MIDKIRNEAQYNQVMLMIEGFLKKATAAGGFNALAEQDANELTQLSLMAEKFEDNVLQIMPLPITINSIV